MAVEREGHINIIGADVTKGTFDEFGRVFDKSKTGDRPFYEMLRPT